MNGSLTTTELKKPHPSRLSQQAGAVSDTPSTWLTLCDPPRRPQETLLHPTYRTIQAVFPYEQLMLHNFLNPINQKLASVSLRPSTSSSHPRFTAWMLLVLGWESPSPAQVTAIPDCFIAHAEWPQAEHRRGLTLACTSRETPGPTHTMDRYRPCCSTTTPPPYS